MKTSLLALVLLLPASAFAAELVPATRQLEIMPPQSSPFDIREDYTAATAVDLGAAGFAVGWDLAINPIDPESVKGVTEGRQVLRSGRPAQRFEASTDVFVPGSAFDISLAAAGKTGRFVAAWAQMNDFFSGEVWFRRFADGHQPLDADAVPITETVDGRMDCDPQVAANAGGRFVVVWKRGPSYQGGDNGKLATLQVLARVFGPDGRPLSPEIAVTAPVPTPLLACAEDPRHPAVGMDAAGGFVVLGAGDGPLPGIWGRRFDPTGAPLGEPFQVSAREGAVNLAMADAGSFVAAWTAPFQRDVTLLGRFLADGRRAAPPVRLPGVFDPALDLDGSGRLAVFWIAARRPALTVFDAALARLAPVVYDPPASRTAGAWGVAFADDGRILTVWLGPHGPKAPDSVLGRIWRLR